MTMNEINDPTTPAENTLPVIRVGSEQLYIAPTDTGIHLDTLIADPVRSIPGWSSAVNTSALLRDKTADTVMQARDATTQIQGTPGMPSMDLWNAVPKAFGQAARWLWSTRRGNYILLAGIGLSVLGILHKALHHANAATASTVLSDAPAAAARTQLANRLSDETAVWQNLGVSDDAIANERQRVYLVEGTPWVSQAAPKVSTASRDFLALGHQKPNDYLALGKMNVDDYLDSLGQTPSRRSIAKNSAALRGITIADK
jgi:hypothetical protein